MAIYRNISISFWTDCKVEDDFSAEDRYVFLYLLTNPYTNLSGCYELSFQQVCRQTGYTFENVESVIGRLENNHHVIRYCRETREVLILNWGRYNWTKSEKLIKPITAAIERIKHRPFQDYVRKLYANLEDIYTVSIPYPYGIDTTVPVTVSDAVSVTDGEINTETKKKKKSIRAVKPEGTPGRFPDFWSAYPKKVAKTTAQTAFKKLNPDAALMEVILKAIEKQKKSTQWTKDNGQFIPNPSTWLNQKRWDDDIPEVNDGQTGASLPRSDRSGTGDARGANGSRFAHLGDPI